MKADSLSLFFVLRPAAQFTNEARGFFPQLKVARMRDGALRASTSLATVEKMARHPLRLAPQRLFELAFEAPASRRREMLFVGFDFRARRVRASLEAAPFTRLSHVVLG